MYFDITYIILVLPAVIFSLWASAKVNGTYRKYKNLGTSSGMTGAQAARLILDRNGLRNVRIMKIDGQLTDHYDPRNRTISLSQDIHDGSSAVAVGIAAHEVGHAIQHAEKAQTEHHATHVERIDQRKHHGAGQKEPEQA